MQEPNLIKRSPAEQVGGDAMRRLLAVAIDGLGPLPSAKLSAGKALEKAGEPEAAINAITRNHIAMAGTQGFLTNVGGLIAVPVLLPTNIAALAVVKLHLAASIAHLRGFDVDDTRVRTAIMLALLTAEGPQHDDLPVSILAVATAPVYNPELDAVVSERAMTEILSVVGGRRAITLVGRGIPLIGGVVGGGMDSWALFTLARHCKAQFLDRRPRLAP